MGKKKLNEKASYIGQINISMIFNYKIYFQYTTIRSFAERIYAGKVTIDEAEEDQSNLLKI